MTKYKSNSRLILILLTISFLSFNSFASEKFSFSTGATYITGDYGSTENTDIYFVPFTFKYKYDKLRLKLTIPYLEKTGPINVIKDLGQVSQEVVTTKTTESGLGDISAAAQYNLYYNKEYKFLINAEGTVNFGTASESKGLGTGKVDYSFKLNLFKVFDSFTPYSKVGYKVYGSPQLKNVIFTSAGVVYKLNSTVSTGVNYSWREKVTDTGAEKHQLTGFSSQKITKKWSIQEYIIKGFSRSTADWGGGISISYGFIL